MSDLTPQQQAEVHRNKVARERAIILANYAKLFESEAGVVVLADLKKHFSADKARFTPATDYNPLIAAKIDGQADVIRHILSSIHESKTQTETTGG